MTTNTGVVAKLFASLGFKVDLAGLTAFEKKLDHLVKQSEQLQKKVQTALSGATKAQAKLNTQTNKSLVLQTKQQRADILGAKLSQEQFKAKLQQSRLTLATHKQEAQAQALAHKATEATIRQQALLERVSQARMRTTALAARIERTEAAAAARRVAAASRSTHSVYASRIGSGAGLPTAGGIAGGVSGFVSTLGPAGLAITALAAAATGAAISLKNYADNAVSLGEKGHAISAQFRALDLKNPKVGQESEKRFYAKANDLGVDAQALAPDYVKSLRALVDSGMSVHQGEAMVNGLTEYAKANNLTADKLALALNAINQASSKGQLMSEEWKSQLAEQVSGADKLGALAWAKVMGRKVNPDNVAQVQRASAQFSKDRGDGKIKGAWLTKFFAVLATDFSNAANKGGMLDQAKVTHTSNEARLANYKAQQARDVFNQNDGEMNKGRQDLDKSLMELQKALDPLNKQLGELASGMLQLLSGIVDLTTSVTYWANRFFPKDEPKAPLPVTGEQSKAYTDKLSKLETTDERDPSKMRPMGPREQADAFLEWNREQARLVGHTLSQVEESRLRIKAQFTSRENLLAEMQGGPEDSAKARDASMRLAETLDRIANQLPALVAQQSLIQAYSPMAIPQPALDVEKVLKAMTLPQASYTIGDIHVYGSGDAEQTAVAVRRELESSWKPSVFQDNGEQ